MSAGVAAAECGRLPRRVLRTRRGGDDPPRLLSGPVHEFVRARKRGRRVRCAASGQVPESRFYRFFVAFLAAEAGAIDGASAAPVGVAFGGLSRIAGATSSPVSSA